MKTPKNYVPSLVYYNGEDKREEKQTDLAFRRDLYVIGQVSPTPGAVA